jgi:Family of unknown function (DUF5996)
MDQRWPALAYDEWRETCKTLQLWLQIVGKVKLELVPFLNEWWNVTLHLTVCGMSTGLIPYRDRAFAVDFDFLNHNLAIETSDGKADRLPLISRSVADFYTEFMASLRRLGIEVGINSLPVEIPEPIPYDEDRIHCSYDPVSVQRWWAIQLQTEKVLQRHRSSFVGKSSPIHFFWGSFDLNHTRFSGRAAPILQEVPRFLQLAEDQENAACGLWPGNPNYSGLTLGQPAFYAYIHPEPEGFRAASVRPGAAYYDTRLGQFILRYQDLRRGHEPEEELLAFFQSTYEAGATLAGWDRDALERQSAEAERP